MASNTVKASGTKLEIKTGTSTYVQVNGFKGFSGLGGGSAAVIDTTDLSSTAKEKAVGLPDEGSVSIDLIHLPKDAGQVAIKAARSTQALTGFRITLSDTTKYEFNAYALNFERGVSVDEVLMASCTLEVSGGITETAAV